MRWKAPPFKTLSLAWSAERGGGLCPWHVGLFGDGRFSAGLPGGLVIGYFNFDLSKDCDDLFSSVFHASISTNWIFLLRCLEIGVRTDFSAGLLSSPQSPQ